MVIPSIDGFAHLDLTVSDGNRAARWWEEVMGFQLFAKSEGPSFTGWTLVHPSGLLVTAIAHDDCDGERFDERRIGLDHVAFRVGDLPTLKAWTEHLDDLGVTHSGVQDSDGERDDPLIVVRDPDNIQIELTAGWHT